MKIPLIGLERQIKSIEDELKKEINQVIKEGYFVLGKYLEMFDN